MIIKKLNKIKKVFIINHLVLKVDKFKWSSQKKGSVKMKKKFRKKN